MVSSPRDPAACAAPRALRVLALIPDAYGSHGGISKFNRDLLTALCADPDCAEVVAMPRLMPEAPGPLPKKLTWITEGLGGKLHYLRAVLKTAIRNPSSSSQDLQPSRGFDLVICGHINLLPAAFLACKLVACRKAENRKQKAEMGRRTEGESRSAGIKPCRPPIALIIHGIDVWEPHRSSLVRWLARRVDAFISVSAFTKERFVRWSRVPAAKGMLLPNCIDLTGFEPGEKDPELLKRYGLRGRKVVMTLARLLPDRPKGIDEVLEALPSLMAEIPQLSYLICGDGIDRPRLADKARSLGLTVADRTSAPSGSGLLSADSPSSLSDLPSPMVVFAGRVPEAEKAAHYRLADAFVMAGYGEGFGIVYLEALACGVPVLASTLDASREALLEGEMGLLVDPRNRAELRQGILRVLQQPRGTVPPRLEYFSFPNFAKRCHAIVNQLCPSAA
ncbi:MAG: glycosyltransferase family 4 protein [Verrucomicrobia bacterium]|nr:glycosyltransferase family 4 protein [Verrucomicrobiota bacterium]